MSPEATPRVARRGVPVRDSLSTRQSLRAEEQRHLEVLKLLPLTIDRVERYLTSYGTDVPVFLQAVEAADAWEFVGRPIDAEDLYVLWRQQGRLGNKTEIVENSVQRSLQMQNDRSGMTADRLRQGAEATAICLQLTRRISVLAADEARAEARHALSLRECIPSSWSSTERRQLLQRAIFDSAAYGAIRFHRGTEQDYLAACALRRQLDADCPYQEVQNLLFATRPDRTLILRPFMASVAAWMACLPGETSRWRQFLNADICNAAPWIFLTYADPQALPTPYRLDLLKSIVERFRGRNHARVPWDPPVLKRFADPQLAGRLSDWILDPTVSTDVRADYIALV